MVINMPDRSMPRVSADPTAAMNTKAGLLMKIINITKVALCFLNVHNWYYYNTSSVVKNTIGRNI